MQSCLQINPVFRKKILHRFLEEHFDAALFSGRQDLDGLAVGRGKVPLDLLLSGPALPSPCLSPCQPNIGRYWPLFIAHPAHSMPCCWPFSVPANQPQGGKGGTAPLLRFPGGGRGVLGESASPKGPYTRSGFSRARIIYD